MIDLLFWLFVAYIIYKLSTEQDTIIIIEIDTNTLFDYRWSKAIKGISIGWVAIHAINCSLGDFAKITTKILNEQEEG